MKVSLGTLAAEGTLGQRDAVHAPCVLGETLVELQPGESVCFPDRYSPVVVACDGNSRHGVVDPFLTTSVKPGDQFWVLLNPESVSNLSHSFVVEFLESVDNGLFETDDDRECRSMGCN